MNDNTATKLDNWACKTGNLLTWDDKFDLIHNIWVSDVFINDRFYGQGEASRKGKARELAAIMAFRNIP